MLPTLAYECAEFLLESGGKPLLKNLPKERDGFRKVKVRHKTKGTDPFIVNFNEAFTKERHNLFQRAVFTNGENSFEPAQGDVEPFYIFPIDGYRYMYNPVGVASTKTYKETFTMLLDNVGDNASELIQAMLRYDYVFDNLETGITSGAEIVLYNLPYYFALRKSLIDDYSSFVRT